MSATVDIQTLQLGLDLPLRPHQIPRLRGAVAEAAGWDQDLFHNHAPSELRPVAEPVVEGDQPQPPAVTLTDRYQYRYPLIHYRCERGQAAIFALNQGAQAVKRWLLASEGSLNMGGQSHPLRIAQLSEQVHTLRMVEGWQGYRLMDYRALHQENYARWQQLDRLQDRIDLLEGVLTGHLLGLCTAFGYRLPQRLEVRLLHLRQARPVRVKGTDQLAFSLIYRSNLLLPPGIALGKGVSHGFGVQRPVRK